MWRVVLRVVSSGKSSGAMVYACSIYLCIGRCEAAWLAGTGAPWELTDCGIVATCWQPNGCCSVCSKLVVVRDWTQRRCDETEAQQCVG